MCVGPVLTPTTTSFPSSRVRSDSSHLFSCPGHKLSAIVCSLVVKTKKDRGKPKLCLKTRTNLLVSTSLTSSRCRELRSIRLHALSDAADEERDLSDKQKSEDRSSSSGDARIISTNESSAEEDLGEVSERWEGGEGRAGASASSSEGLGTSKSLEETAGISDPSTSGANANAEGAAGEEAQTQRVLDILHRRKEPARDQGPSLRERFGGFRVSGPQVPLTLQPLKARKEDEGAGAAPGESAKDVGGNKESEEFERQAEGIAESEGVKVDAIEESVSSPEALQSGVGDSEERIGTTSGENAASQSTAELSPDIAEGSETKAPDAGDPNETAEKKKKPLVIPPGPSVAEIPLPTRTDEDERLIAVFEKKLNADWKVDGVESELQLYVAKVKALEKFKAELARPDEDINLVRAAALIAQHA